MNKQQSLHAYIKEEILHKIHTNDYKIGEKIPTEHELCDLFSVSRTTIRTALNQLTMEGYLIRHQGKGTFVAEQKVQQTLTQTSKRYKDQIAVQGKEGKTKLLSLQVIPADKMIERELQVPLQSPVQRIERIRFANGEPTQYEVAYIPWEVAPGLTQEHAETSLYEALKSTFDVSITYTSEKVEIALADEVIAEHLRCEQHTPYFYIETIAENENKQRVEFSKSYFRGDKTSFIIERHY